MDSWSEVRRVGLRSSLELAERRLVEFPRISATIHYSETGDRGWFNHAVKDLHKAPFATRLNRRTNDSDEKADASEFVVQFSADGYEDAAFQAHYARLIPILDGIARGALDMLLESPLCNNETRWLIGNRDYDHRLWMLFLAAFSWQPDSPIENCHRLYRFLSAKHEESGLIFDNTHYNHWPEDVKYRLATTFQIQISDVVDASLKVVAVFRRYLEHGQNFVSHSRQLTELSSQLTAAIQLASDIVHAIEASDGGREVSPEEIRARLMSWNSFCDQLRCVSATAAGASFNRCGSLWQSRRAKRLMVSRSEMLRIGSPWNKSTSEERRQQVRNYILKQVIPALLQIEGGCTNSLQRFVECFNSTSMLLANYLEECDSRTDCMPTQIELVNAVSDGASLLADFRWLKWRFPEESAERVQLISDRLSDGISMLRRNWMGLTDHVVQTQPSPNDLNKRILELPSIAAVWTMGRMSVAGATRSQAEEQSGVCEELLRELNNCEANEVESQIPGEDITQSGRSLSRTHVPECGYFSEADAIPPGFQFVFDGLLQKELLPLVNCSRVEQLKVKSGNGIRFVIRRMKGTSWQLWFADVREIEPTSQKLDEIRAKSHERSKRRAGSTVSRIEAD